ncbi:chaplin [Streptomyces sp. NPDC001817]|uniref:chaplin n=1 Tax=Streptomyces sp. NPDC001817 TaxID=3154398 RepID=UPI0033321E3C
MRVRSVLATVALAAVVAAGVAGSAAASSGAEGATVNDPGVVSGNVIQVPVEVPVNACATTANVVGVPSHGNLCVND